MRRCPVLRRLTVSSLVVAVVTVALGVVATTTATPVRAQGTFVTLAEPSRLLDTRGAGLTIDGQFSGGGLVGTASRPSVALTVRGRAGVPSSATAVVVNVTATGSTAGGYVTVWPGGSQPATSTLNFSPGQTIANAAVVGTSGAIRVFASVPTHLIVDITGYFSGAETFRPLTTPARLADTRSRTQGPLSAGEALTVSTGGVAGVDDGSAAVALNITATDAREPGFLTVYPCGSSRPNASSLNFARGDTVANAVIARPGTGGRICVFTSAATHVIVDAAGSFPLGGPLSSLTAPARVLDTRPGAATSDGQQAGAGLRSGGSTLRLPVAGRVGVPSSATAVVLNVTVTVPQGPGYVTAYPAGIPLPDTSNLNFETGQTIPNAVIAGVGPDGNVCLFTSATAHLIVDVTGYLTGSAAPSSSTSCTVGGGTDDDVGGDGSGDAAQRLVAAAEELRFVGTDRVAVWICNVPEDSTGYVEAPLDETVTPQLATSWATSNIASYYRDVSRGRYVLTFTAAGTIDLEQGDDRDVCLAEARSRTDDPFTNVLAVSDRNDGGGFAGPGASTGLDSGPPSVTGRGMYLGGSSVFRFASPTIGVHELGHTLSWPHSYLGSWPYDNAMDMMSGDPAQGLCSVDVPEGRYRFPCAPQHTLAFNRLAAGWVDDTQVVVHTAGTAAYTLAPPATGGVQLVAAPFSDDEQALLTIEARPATGYDQYLDAEGVVVHRIDQRGTACGSRAWEGRCSGIVRRVAQARGPVDQGECGGTLDQVCSTEHVIGVGESMTVHGITIRVDARQGDTYRVTVTGAYRAPDALPSLAGFALADISSSR